MEYPCKRRPDAGLYVFSRTGNSARGRYAYIGQQGLSKEERIFPITRQHAHRIVRDAFLEAGTEKKRAHPHVLRHSFSVNAVLQRVLLPKLQKWLGHSDIKNTMVYLQILSQDTRDFYEALEFFD